MNCVAGGAKFELRTGPPSAGKPGYANVCPNCSPPTVMLVVPKTPKPRIRRPKTAEDYARKLRRLDKLKEMIDKK